MPRGRRTIPTMVPPENILAPESSLADLAHAALSYGNNSLSRNRMMCPKEGTYLAHRQGNPLLGLLPREDAHFGIWREHRGLHGDGVGMRRDIIRQDQDGRLAMANEIA